MPAKRFWTPTEDQRIAVSRLLGRNWDSLAADLAASRSAVIERAHELGVPRMPRPAPPPSDEGHADEAAREPLPTGHPIAWAVLTERTLLAGAPFIQEA